MILIDSLYINNSGGLRLLQYLIKTLELKNIDFFLLADERCSNKFNNNQNVQFLKASLFNRWLFYRKNNKHYSSVLCFGNIPTPIRLDIPVYTYFHNINLLTLNQAHNLKGKTIAWMKRQVFRHYKKNTDYWLVQTTNTANELILHLEKRKEKVIILPFFELSLELISLNHIPHGNDYVFISNYTGAKGHEELLEAWCLLHQKGFDFNLHLTVPFNCSNFIKKIKKAQEGGVRIINHGIIPSEKVIELYGISKAIIYPSHNESLGLGIIEAIAAGCDVIGANLPYIHAICKPSIVFNPYDAESIAIAVLEYENNKKMKSELLVHNMIDELIQLLIDKQIVFS